MRWKFPRPSGNSSSRNSMSESRSPLSIDAGCRIAPFVTRAVLLVHVIFTATGWMAPRAAHSQSLGRANSSALPWKSGGRAADPAQLAELLQMYGVTGADLAAFADPELPADERQTILLRTLYYLPRLTPAEWDRWRAQAPGAEQLRELPQQYRGYAVYVEGQCRKVTRHEVPAALQETLEYRYYFELAIETSAPAVQWRAYTREIPQAWLGDDPIDQPARLQGVFLDSLPGDGESQPVLVVAAPRAAWHPTSPLPEAGIGPAQVALARLGVDFGRFDGARRRNGLEMDNNERELFYQVLAALSHASSPLDAPMPLDLPRVLTKPGEHQGQLLNTVAYARRITEITVEDRDIRERFGIRSYYQIDALLQLGQQQIRLESPRTGASAVYTDKFPITVCVTSVPSDLLEKAEAARQTPGEPPLINERIELTGVFFKLWPYSSEFLRAIDPLQQQPSPLLLGATVVPAPIAPPSRDTPLGIAMALGFALVLIVGTALLWRGSRVRRERRRHLLPPHA